MNRLLMLLVLLWGCVTTAQVAANDALDEKVNDAVATKTPPALVSDDYREHPQLLDIVARLGEGALVRGNFAQTRTLAGLPMPIRASGVFVFWRGQGLYQEGRTPFFNAFTITPRQLISWDEAGVGREVQEQSALVQREINKTLLSFFDADLIVIAQRFNTQWTLWDDGRWQLLLTPKLAILAEQMQSITLNGKAMVENGKAMVESISIAARADHTHLQFSDQILAAAPTVAECAKFVVSAQLSEANCGRFE